MWMEQESSSEPLKDYIEEVVKFTLESHVNKSLSFDLNLSDDFCFHLLNQLNDAVSLPQAAGLGEGSCYLYRKLAWALYDQFNNAVNDLDSEGEASKSVLLHEGTQLVNIFKSVNFHVHVQENFFTLLKDGLKTVEGRCAVGDYNKIGSEAVILFNKRLLTGVQSVSKYSSFAEMLEAETLENVLPGVKTIDDGVKVYRQFYTEEKEMSNGVLAIHVSTATEQPYMYMARILCELGKEGIEKLLS